MYVQAGIVAPKCLQKTPQKISTLPPEIDTVRIRILTTSTPYVPLYLTPPTPLSVMQRPNLPIRHHRDNRNPAPRLRLRYHQLVQVTPDAARLHTPRNSLKRRPSPHIIDRGLRARRTRRRRLISDINSAINHLRLRLRDDLTVAAAAVGHV